MAAGRRTESERFRMAHGPLRIVPWLALAGLAMPAALRAQTQFLINDRTNDTIYRVIDLNGNGTIDEPGEVFAWFSGANAAGTLAIQNPTCLAVRPDGAAIMGDQLNRNVYAIRDMNRDGDAQDVGESIVGADATNLSGVSFAFPTGAAFDSLGRAYVVNAGNASGDDGIYRLVDLNADGDFQDAGEVTHCVTTGAFGPGNGPYSPQEVVLAPGDVGYVRNSSSGLHGIYRFVDSNGNGRADDPGEFTVFLDASNAPGVPVLAGFALELAPGANSLYTQQTATGGVDQILRATDLNADNDAQDAGEVVMVYETAEAGFTLIDLVSLPNGDLLLTDNSANRVVRLRDLDLDGTFMQPGERTDFFLNSTPILGAVRQMNDLPVRIPCSGDLNGDGVFSLADTTEFVEALLDPTGVGIVRARAADLNCDNSTDGRDVTRFLHDLIP